MGKPHTGMPKRQTQREGADSPPLAGPMHNTGVMQPEGIGPSKKSIEPSGGPLLRADVVSPAPDNATRADTLSAHGNCYEDDGTTRCQASGEMPMCKRVEPSKGKGRVPLDTHERWQREHSSS